MFDWLTLRHTSPELASDQLRDLSHYISLIYAIVAVNMLFSFWGSWNAVPPWMILAVIVPAALIVTRRIGWWRGIARQTDGNIAGAHRSLRITVVVMPLAGLMFSTLAVFACIP